MRYIDSPGVASVVHHFLQFCRGFFVRWNYLQAWLQACTYVEYSVDLELICHVLCRLAFEHWDRFMHSGERRELDATIFHDRIVLGLRSEGHPSRCRTLIDLGIFLRTRFQKWGKLEDLEEAVDLHRTALKLRSKDDPNCSLFLNNLAMSLQTRFERHGQAKDLDESIELLRTDLELHPQGHSHRYLSLANLAMSLRTRFNQHGRMDDLEESIELHHAALELCTKGHPHRSSILSNLANSLFARFEQGGHADDLDNVVELHRSALELCPTEQHGRSDLLNNLAGALFVRFDQREQPDDLVKAIEFHRAALELRPEGHPRRSSSLNNLATALLTRFKCHENAEDLDEAIELHRAALKLRPSGHPDRFSALNNLASSLQSRFILHQKIGDLDEAVEVLRAALELRPEGDPNRFKLLNNLASSLEAQYEQHGRMEDLDESVELRRVASELCPDGHLNHSRLLNGFANSLQTQFILHGRTEDLEKAIKLYRAELEPGRRRRYDSSLSLNNLATSLQTRFRHHGRTEDLDEAIELHRAAAKLLPEGHLEPSVSMVNLANCLITRSNQHGWVKDLDEAIKLYRMALELCANYNLLRSTCLNNLATSLVVRSVHCGWNEEDIDEVIELLQTAVETVPVHHPDRFLNLNSLATTLCTRYDLHGQTEDIENAVRLHHTALQLCPKGHHNRSLLLNNFATSLHGRFNLHGRMEDIGQATEFLYTALELRPEGHSDRSSTLYNLANCLYVRFQKCRCAADFQECIRLLELATTHSFSGLRIRLLAGRLWTELARRHDHKSTITAYSTATTLLQNALTVSPTLHKQHETLAGYSDFASLALEAASYAVEKNELALAMEILEQGRGLLWSQMRGLRSPLDHLVEINKELSDRFRDVSQRLENLATSSITLSSGLNEVDNKLLLPNIQSRQQSFDEMLMLKGQLAKEQGEIIKEIRRLPGFENFLTATPFKVLQRAASEGPVIVVNQCRFRSDALIILPRENFPVVCIPLDGHFYKDSIKLYSELLTTREKYTASSPEYEEKLIETTKLLWDRVVVKIVNKLEELEITEGSRIWWCPTSVLSAMPFHAAGPFEDKDGTSKYLLDKYISSYTPTLGALINARLGGNGVEPKVLVIGDTSLPSAKGEICKIRNCGISTKVLRAKASRDVIIEALRKTTWVHFVCHGSLDSKPLNSSFKVSDRGLTLLDIVQGNVPNAEFAFLSACHTAEQPPGGTQDEVLHLAAAMQFSGFRSVIGSMWALLDADGPFFAKTIYEYMWDCDEGEARYKRAAAGLRQAAVDLKARGGVQTERWVNLVHIGA